MKRSAYAAAVTAVVVSAVACQSARPAPPLSPRTTDGAIAVGNLQAQIDGEQRLARFGPLSVAQRAGIIGLIETRGQFFGRIADYEQADALAEALVAEAPQDGRAWLARAGTRATLHRFRDALSDIDAAERLNAPAVPVLSARAGVLQATGQYDAALVLRQIAANAHPDTRSLGGEAVLYAERGDVADAVPLFARAVEEYHDVSPFPIAWLEFQQGLMWMREGDLTRARELFAAAHQRLPIYAAAQGHLAEVEAARGDTDAAIALLRPLADTADDPDYAAQLARICAVAGRLDDATRWRAAAQARYDELVARHPEAFADHAAEFWLIAGDASRALRLAEMNVELRPTPRAYELWLTAALAAGRTDATCAAAEHVADLPHLWPALRQSASRAAPLCGLRVQRG